MKLLAGLMFNRVRIALQSVYVIFQQVVFPLQAMQLLIQGLCVLPFLFVRSQSILSEDHVVAHRQSEDRRSTRSELAPAELSSFEDTRDGTRLPSTLAYCR